ncbi:MAG: PQQ-dependent sugar dehydrogenase [Flavobacterium sp.]|nr:PQQ-dependent sugar dehydrogenase [Pedobacter sp.]
MKLLIIFLAITTIALFSFNCKKSKPTQQIPISDAQIQVGVLTSGLSHPWELLWGPDNFLWVTERDGKVSRIDPKTGNLTLVANINDVVSRGEGGLLGMALHPDFSTVPEVYVAYNYLKESSYTEKIVKYTYNGTTLSNPIVLLDNIAANTFHNGCRLLISSEKKLFISTGDAGNQPLSQNINSTSGKILRINLDGTIPSDNPVSGNPIWSFGHRNAQGLVFGNGLLYSSEHGPNTDDEFNVIRKGINYGWPDVHGFCDENSEKDFCSKNNVAEPLKAWTPTIAVSGIDFYNSDFIPQWKNSVIMATLKDESLYQLKLNPAGDAVADVTKIISGDFGRLRDVCIAPDGKVYLVTGNGSNDKVIVISKKL